MKPVLKRKDTPARLKVKIIQALVFPVVLYGGEAWSLLKDENCKLKAFETKAYRRALDIHYEERVSNREVLERAGSEAMIERAARTREMRYSGHVCSAPTLRRLQSCLEWPKGLKRQGGQRQQWIDDIGIRTSTTNTVRQTPNGRTPKSQMSKIPDLVVMACEREECAVHNFANPAQGAG